jgi:hypothetical protein
MRRGAEEIMLKTEWAKLKFFKETENWGDPSKMDFRLLWLLDCYREYIDQEILVTFGTQGEHVAHSQHPSGHAVDIVVDAAKKGPLFFLLSAFKFPFSGIGIYPNARYAKFQRPLGLHFDTREMSPEVPRGTCANHWIGIRNAVGKIDYYKLEERHMRAYGII